MQILSSSSSSSSSRSSSRSSSSCSSSRTRTCTRTRSSRRRRALLIPSQDELNRCETPSILQCSSHTSKASPNPKPQTLNTLNPKIQRWKRHGKPVGFDLPARTGAYRSKSCSWKAYTTSTNNEIRDSELQHYTLFKLLNPRRFKYQNSRGIGLNYHTLNGISYFTSI